MKPNAAATKPTENPPKMFQKAAVPSASDPPATLMMSNTRLVTNRAIGKGTRIGCTG